MTENEMHDALTVAGWERVNTAANQRIQVPFEGYVKCNVAVYRRGLQDRVYLHLPMAGMNYSTRALKKMHGECMKNLRRWGLDMGAEVLGVLGKCS